MARFKYQDRVRYSEQSGRPFAEQIDFFRRKLNLPTRRWDDIEKAAHDRAFIVAGAAKADLLHDPLKALHRAIEDKFRAGQGLDEFRRDFKKIVEQHGWHGWTGEGTKAGEAWRTRVIYETNLRTSYAAGRWRQLNDPNLAKVAPYWQYVHSGKEHFRPQHRAWGNARLTLPREHPFWKTHYPPNGWGCGCTVTAVVAPRVGAMTTPPDGWDSPDPKTGTPPGIGKGWDYAPGANTDMELRCMVQDKLITYPPAIQRALISEIGRKINAINRIEDYIDAVLQDPSRTDDLWLGFVERPERFADVVKTDLSHYLALLPSGVAQHVKKRHQYDGKGQRMATPEDLGRLLHGLETGNPVPAGYNDADKHERFLVTWEENGEKFRAVWEVREGKRNRAVALVSLVIKTLGGK